MVPDSSSISGATKDFSLSDLAVPEIISGSLFFVYFTL